MASFGIGNPFWMYMLPEYELEGYWVCKIEDNDIDMSHGATNSIFVDTFMPMGFDNYVQSVSIPQLNLDYEITNYGLMTFKEKSPYDDITITFYDDIRGSCLGFFKKWLECVYNEDKCRLESNWRYESKRITVKYFRQFETGIKTIAAYTMVRCLPKSIAEIDSEDEGEGRKTFSVTLTTQRVYDTTTKAKNKKYPHTSVFV